MGFLDKYKKQKDLQPEINYNKNLRTYDIQYGTTDDGNLQIDYCDIKPEFKQFYDTTRLIVNKTPLNIADQEVYECMVSWYNQNDCQMFDRKTGKFEWLNAINYRDILVQIDLYLLQNDPEYCNFVMKNLLNRERVERYLETGLKDRAEQPCGKYIGGVMQIEGKNRKFFSIPLGKASHFSGLMINRRNERKKGEIERKRRQIEEKQNEISDLQNEIDRM